VHNQIEFTKDFILAKGKTNRNIVFIWFLVKLRLRQTWTKFMALGQGRGKVKNCPNCQLNYGEGPENNVRNGNAGTGPIKLQTRTG